MQLYFTGPEGLHAKFKIHHFRVVLLERPIQNLRDINPLIPCPGPREEAKLCLKQHSGYKGCSFFDGARLGRSSIAPLSSGRF